MDSHASADPILLELQHQPIDPCALFGNGNPTQLEIGPGKGLFLAESAALDPSQNFIGVEIARKYARFAAERAARRKLANVRIVCGDARWFLHFCPAGCFAAVHVYFPDPWWKRRHKKRRVFTKELVNAVARSLRVGGALHVATDVNEYFGVITSTVRDTGLFRLIEPESQDARKVITSFERKYRAQGRSIDRADYEYLGGAPAELEPPGDVPAISRRAHDGAARE